MVERLDDARVEAGLLDHVADAERGGDLEVVGIVVRQQYDLHAGIGFADVADEAAIRPPCPPA